MLAAGTALPPHPRLLVRALEQLQSAFARPVQPGQGDALRVQLLDTLVALADVDLLAPPIERDQTKIGADGKRVQFHHEARKAVSVILDCSAAFFITNDAKYLRHTVGVMTHVVSFPDWNGAEKFLDVAEMSFALSIGYDWLYDFIEPSDRNIIAAGLKRHALDYAPAVYSSSSNSNSSSLDHGQLDWARKNNNVNIVCNCGLLSAALALGDVEPELLQTVLLGLIPSVTNGMSSYNPEGGWHEGPQYWSFGTQFAVNMLAMLESALGTDLGIPALFPGFARTALYRYHILSPIGQSFNYGDNGQAKMSAEPHLTWLAQRFGHDHVAAYSRALLQERLGGGAGKSGKGAKKHNKFDRTMALHALWFPADNHAGGASQSEQDKLLDVRFRGHTEVVTMCSTWRDAARAVYVGIKGGSNGGTHGHLDLGSFVLDAGGERWALDLGGDDYALPAYASKHELSARWSYLRTSNRGHNVFTLGTLTEPGRNHVSRSLQSLSADAPLTHFFSSPDVAHAAFDMSHVYPAAPAGLQARRGVRLLDRRSHAQVLVQDEFESAGGAGEGSIVAVIWRLFTPAQISVQPDGQTAVLTIQDKQMIVQILDGGGQARFGSSSAHPDEPSPIPEPDVCLFASAGGGTSCDDGEEEEEEMEEEEEIEEVDDDDDEVDEEAVAGTAVLENMTPKERKKAAQKAVRRKARHAVRAEEREIRRAQKAALKGGRSTAGKKDKSGSKTKKASSLEALPEQRFRRGVDRSLVKEDANEGVRTLFITASFLASERFVLPVLFTPLFDVGSGVPAGLGAAVTATTPIEAWQGRL